MSFVGTIHEISFYGLLSSVVCILAKLTNVKELISSATHVSSFSQFFLCFLFWASVLFIPIAIIGAFATKYGDEGLGLSFYSTNLLVIIFAHIGEELLGLVATPFWFLIDLFRKSSKKQDKTADYLVYLFLLVFIFFGFRALILRNSV